MRLNIMLLMIPVMFIGCSSDSNINNSTTQEQVSKEHHINSIGLPIEMTPNSTVQENTDNTNNINQEDINNEIVKEFGNNYIKAICGEGVKNDLINNYLATKTDRYYLPVSETDIQEQDITAPLDAIDAYAQGLITDEQEREQIKQDIINNYGEEYHTKLINGEFYKDQDSNQSQNDTQSVQETQSDTVKFDTDNKPYVEIADLEFGTQGIASVTYNNTEYAVFRSETGYSTKEIQEKYTSKDFRLYNIYPNSNTYDIYYKTLDDDITIGLSVTIGDGNVTDFTEIRE